MLAKAVAGEADVPFFSISGSEFVEMFVGYGCRKVRDLFKQANEKAPAYCFIDEIDAVGKKKREVKFGGTMSGADVKLSCQEMDGFDGSKGVVLRQRQTVRVSRPCTFVQAVLTAVFRVELPDLMGREDILKVHAAKIKIADNVDFNAIARTAAGASGAELANIVNEAALRAVRDGRKICNTD